MCSHQYYSLMISSCSMTCLYQYFAQMNISTLYTLECMYGKATNDCNM